jgi:hypothetical protein
MGEGTSPGIITFFLLTVGFGIGMAEIKALV